MNESWICQSVISIIKAHNNLQNYIKFLLHFVAFFHVASLFSIEVENKKVGVDNEKALELDNRMIFSYFSLISM